MGSLLRQFVFLLALLLAACGPAPPPAPAALGVGVDYDVAADWPGPARDFAATRHSPLQQIDVRNVADLRPVWAYALSAGFTSADRVAAVELRPIVIGGVLYATAADRVVALNAHSGAELWRHTVDGAVPSQHGVAYWAGNAAAAARIFFTTGRRLVALEAATGERVMQFGTNGELEMPAVPSATLMVFENVVLVAGDGVHAFDAGDGSALWSFGAAEVGSGEVVPKAASALTIDVDRGLLFVTLAARAVDEHYGGARPDDNALDNALIALDVRSGARRWQFQPIRHDVWGYDLATAPALIDATVDGRRVAALALPSPSGHLYLLERGSGVPLFRLVEVTVPTSNVPGERSAPTQPIPGRPGPLARVSFSAAEVVTSLDTTAAHARRCRELIERSGGADNLGPFTPYRYREPATPPRSTVVFPGAGAGQHGGVAADPKLGLVFVNTTNVGNIGWIEASATDATAAPTAPGTQQRSPYRRMSAAGSSASFAASFAEDAADAATGPTWPCQKPPWGQLAAVAVATGEIAWQVPLGITTELPEERRRTGRANRGEPMTTAAGLVFIGATDDRRLRAFDSRSGVELWATELPLSAHTAPITYLGTDGKQYLAVVAAGGDSVDDPLPAEAGVIIGYGLP